MRQTNGQRRPARLAIGITLALAASTVLGSATAAAATKTPFNTNLVKNPGAEAGAGTNGYSSVTIPHWKPINGLTVVRYGAPGFPTKSESSRIGGGKKFFSCGQGVSSAFASQDIQPKGRQTLIDNQHVKVILKARLAGYGAQQDSAQVHLDFVKGGQPFESIETAAVAASDGLFITKSVSAIVPANTTVLRVYMVGHRANNGGTYCDAYFDNVSLVLKLV